MIDFSQIQHRQAEPGAGKLLISDPFLPDPNFSRSVVLLTEHQEDVGSFGFVLNQTAGVNLDEVVDFDVKRDFPLFTGGPVQQETLHLLHKDDYLAESDMEILSGVYWGAQFESLKQLLQSDSADVDNFRFFLGYSGWGPGQLEQEIQQKSWIVIQANSEIVFSSDTDAMWQAVLRSLGGTYSLLANSPNDPQWN
jgi:putative transcriptional regulator